MHRIGEVYAIEASLRGQSPAHRLIARRSQSRPIIEKLHHWLEAQLSHLSQRAGLADAIPYALVRWIEFRRFLHDGHIDLDTNPAERAIRPVTLGAKTISLLEVMVEVHVGPLSVHSAKPANSMVLNPMPAQRMFSPEWSMDTPSTVSMSCFHGTGHLRSTRKIKLTRKLWTLTFKCPEVHFRTKIKAIPNMQASCTNESAGDKNPQKAYHRAGKRSPILKLPQRKIG